MKVLGMHANDCKKFTDPLKIPTNEWMPNLFMNIWEGVKIGKPNLPSNQTQGSFHNHLGRYSPLVVIWPMVIQNTFKTEK